MLYQAIHNAGCILPLKISPLFVSQGTQRIWDQTSNLARSQCLTACGQQKTKLFEFLIII